MSWLLLVIVGLVAGTLGSLMGLGGGIIVVPSLLLLDGVLPILQNVTPQVAAGTSLLIMIFTGISSTIAYAKQKTIDFKSGAIFSIGIVPGAICGVVINRAVNTDDFLMYFGFFMLVVAFTFFIRKYLKPMPLRPKGYKRTVLDREGNEFTYGYQPVFAVVLSFFVGIISSLFGVGGGALMVPFMIILFGFPAHVAVATSMFVILVSAFIGSISHMAAGHVNWLYALALVPGAWFGGQLGAAINRRISSDRLIFILRIFMVLIAIRLIFQGING
ncbi:sulfite exporter TauE/SafE family protein [Alkalicoccobacillus porphyridii]|uniref:Probable membrane transporter protein n=1 Tax=Alkalicoccobacillus porphyridii TaxID=2597270 RepID=A0A554A3H0_9BACI|nr:sulfite exporter TauE/SafE family protein [Alkalicoccobacillus porphyridii]TSB48228.1 sulfite exporter TauE/SafE family protein [Alkalicoccobacillus porphyridii]